MGTGAKIAIGAGAAICLFIASYFMMYFGAKNTCIQFENDIDAQYDKNQVALAGYTNKIMDMVQVPAMAVSAIEKIAKAAIQGRYGADGSKAVFQAIQEQNPTVDQGLYRQIMQAMEAGRNSFDADQTTLLDKCRVYKNYYGAATITGWMVENAGYPRYDKTKCDPVITEQVRQDFKTKTTGPLKLTP